MAEIIKYTVDYDKELEDLKKSEEEETAKDIAILRNDIILIQKRIDVFSRYMDRVRAAKTLVEANEAVEWFEENEPELPSGV